MDTSALESAISTAEKSVDALYPWLFVATAVVVIGLVVEYWPDVKKLLSERPLDRKLMIEMIGGALVTIGVAGELMVQSYLSTAETTLRGADHKYSAELALRATTAENQIATTKAQTAQLQRDNLTLQKQVADAQKAAGALRVAIADPTRLREKWQARWRILAPLPQVRPKILFQHGICGMARSCHLVLLCFLVNYVHIPPVRFHLYPPFPAPFGTTRH